jgi:hypothetical protein
MDEYRPCRTQLLSDRPRAAARPLSGPATILHERPKPIHRCSTPGRPATTGRSTPKVDDKYTRGTWQLLSPASVDEPCSEVPGDQGHSSPRTCRSQAGIARWWGCLRLGVTSGSPLSRACIHSCAPPRTMPASTIARQEPARTAPLRQPLPWLCRPGAGERPEQCPGHVVAL